MKTIVATVFLLLFSSAYAQISQIGASGGFNIANVVGPDAGAENEVRVGFYFGAYTQIDLSDKMHLRPELSLLSQKGTRNGNVKVNVNYLSVPVTLAYNLTDDFSLSGGLSLSVLYNAHVNDGRGDISEFINTLDGAILFGGIYQFNDKIAGSLRFTRSLSRLGDDGVEDTYNFVAQFGVFYTLNAK
jgi:hypothetical protein